MSINTDQMQGKKLTVGILYPPVELPRPKLAKLYATIAEKHSEYESFSSLPDGAVLASSAGNCLVQSARLQINEDFGLFQVIQEKSVDIMHIVADRLEIRQFLGFGVKIAATVPMKSGKEAGPFLERSLLRLSTEQMDRLGTKRAGAGLRAFIEREGGVYILQLEPFFEDRSQIFLEVDVQYPGPFAKLDGVAEKIKRVYDYVFSDVKSFMKELREEQ